MKVKTSTGIQVHIYIKVQLHKSCFDVTVFNLITVPGHLENVHNHDVDMMSSYFLYTGK